MCSYTCFSASPPNIQVEMDHYIGTGSFSPLDQFGLQVHNTNLPLTFTSNPLQLNATQNNIDTSVYWLNEDWKFSMETENKATLLHHSGHSSYSSSSSESEFCGFIEDSDALQHEITNLTALRKFMGDFNSAPVTENDYDNMSIRYDLPLTPTEEKAPTAAQGIRKRMVADGYCDYVHGKESLPEAKRLCSRHVPNNIIGETEGAIHDECTEESASGQKPLGRRGSATDPQSVYARNRREKINERLRILQNLVPNGNKVDISTMLEQAIQYVKFMQLQIKLLSSDEHWMYTPIAFNGLGIDINSAL